MNLRQVLPLAKWRLRDHVARAGYIAARVHFIVFDTRRGGRGLEQSRQQRHPCSRPPGYWRYLRVEPQREAVLAMLEDDLHCMAVRLCHDGAAVIGVDPVTVRAPWDICPGAVAVLKRTFEGLALSQVSPRLAKQQNCTHLHDLAVFAAAHVHDDHPTEYRIFASDPVRDERILEIGTETEIFHRWVERAGVLEEPVPIEGLTLLTLRDWIATLEGREQETARMLQWASLVAHGRTMTSEERQSSIGTQPRCYAFQPERSDDARPAGEILDFTTERRAPLEPVLGLFSKGPD